MFLTINRVLAKRIFIHSLQMPDFTNSGTPIRPWFPAVNPVPVEGQESPGYGLLSISRSAGSTPRASRSRSSASSSQMIFHMFWTHTRSE